MSVKAEILREAFTEAEFYNLTTISFEYSKFFRLIQYIPGVITIKESMRITNRDCEAINKIFFMRKKTKRDLKLELIKKNISYIISEFNINNLRKFYPLLLEDTICHKYDKVYIPLEENIIKLSNKLHEIKLDDEMKLCLDVDELKEEYEEYVFMNKGNRDVYMYEQFLFNHLCELMHYFFKYYHKYRMDKFKENHLSDKKLEKRKDK